MKILIGFVINPIAGMGGRVGLKGTDGVYKEAVKRGATPVAQEKAKEAINSFLTESDETNNVCWLTSGGSMGEDVLISCGINPTVVHQPSSNTDFTVEDTKKACKIFLNHNVDLIVFCGGDGTARDVVDVIKKKIPLLGIPSGVKMHSGVFGVTPAAAGKMIQRFVEETVSVGDVEIMDLDETLYRQGTWKVRLYDTAQGIIEPSFIQVGKASFAQIDDDEIKDDISDHIKEELEKHQDTLYLFGSGGTIDYVAQRLGIENTILGIDAVYEQKTIVTDANEETLLSLLEKYPQVKVILSPIGAQGFIFGRGNLQLSPEVIRNIGIENIIVISTPSKLKATPVIRVDTGDPELDKEFIEYEMMMVVIGYRMSRVVKIESV